MAGYERTLVPDFMSTRPPSTPLISYWQKLEISVEGYFERNGVTFAKLKINSTNTKGEERIAHIDAMCDSGCAVDFVLNENLIEMFRFEIVKEKISAIGFNGRESSLGQASAEVCINNKKRQIIIIVKPNGSNSIIGSQLLREIGYFKYMTEKEVVKN